MITFAMNSDIPILKKIWKEIFHDEDWYLDDFFRTYFKEGKSCLIWKEDDKIVAMLHMIPYTYRICPHENKNAIYLYALATLEEYRGKGIMDALILEAFGSAGDSGEVSFLLIAASEELIRYYKKRGFQRLHYGSAYADPEQKHISMDHISTVQNEPDYTGFLFREEDMLFYLRTLLQEHTEDGNQKSGLNDPRVSLYLSQDYTRRLEPLSFAMIRTKDEVLFLEQGIRMTDLWMMPL
ncbi:MAG: GNAT family N-acetyltransferase [Lachnospiraceae bacterium]|nr:GNAT family N-acetyltransferase [Lachnospiraceae bacterium]